MHKGFQQNPTGSLTTNIKMVTIGGNGYINKLDGVSHFTVYKYVKNIMLQKLNMYNFYWSMKNKIKAPRH